MLNLPTLKCQILQGDYVIELYKVITDKQDSDITLKFNTIPAAVTRGDMYEARQDCVGCNPHKFSFSNSES